MSYIALATDFFEEASQFYERGLGFPVTAQWDRRRGRGRRIDLGSGLCLELLDSPRVPENSCLHRPGDRVHLVVEVPDADAARRHLAIEAPAPEAVSWGARLFQVRDPGGVPITFLEWTTRTGGST